MIDDIPKRWVHDEIYLDFGWSIIRGMNWHIILERIIFFFYSFAENAIQIWKIGQYIVLFVYFSLAQFYTCKSILISIRD